MRPSSASRTSLSTTPGTYMAVWKMVRERTLSRCSLARSRRRGHTLHRRRLQRDLSREGLRQCRYRPEPAVAGREPAGRLQPDVHAAPGAHRAGHARHLHCARKSHARGDALTMHIRNWMALGHDVAAAMIATAT